MVEALNLGYSINRRFENLRATMVLDRPTVIVPGSESRHSIIYIALVIGSTAISSPDTNRTSTRELRSHLRVAHSR